MRMMVRPALPLNTVVTNRMAFATKTEKSDDLGAVDSFSLDAFYMDTKAVPLTDEEAKRYMDFGAKLAMVSFKDDAEMMSFKNDFSAALGFLDKLDEVDVKGVEPLGNVLEIYGGNQHNMRSDEDFERKDDDQTANVDFKEELKKMNKHMDGNYVVLNKAGSFNPDSE